MPFAEDRDHHGSLPRADVALQVKNLLPGAQHQLAVGDGHAERGAQQRGLQVAMAVAVVPGLLVAVLAAGRDQAVEQFRQVALESRLELDGPHGGGAAEANTWATPVCDARASDRLGPPRR